MSDVIVPVPSIAVFAAEIDALVKRGVLINAGACAIFPP